MEGLGGIEERGGGATNDQETALNRIYGQSQYWEDHILALRLPDAVRLAAERLAEAIGEVYQAAGASEGWGGPKTVGGPAA